MGVLEAVREEIISEGMTVVESLPSPLLVETEQAQVQTEPLPVPLSDAEKNNALNVALNTRERSFRFVYGR